MKNKNNTLNMTLAALFLALSYVMPFLTGQIPEFGAMLCPMHIPILLCGYFCGWSWGLGVGFAAPLLRSLTLGMPPLFPTGICMAFELATYGLIAGLLYKVLPKKKIFVFVSLVIAMIFGRAIWGIAMFLLIGATGGTFTFAAFITGAVANSIPGIIIQLILVPVLVISLNKSRFIS